MLNLLLCMKTFFEDVCFAFFLTLIFLMWLDAVIVK